jgi:hypothetical protein
VNKNLQVFHQIEEQLLTLIFEQAELSVLVGDHIDFHKWKKALF